MAIDLRYIHNGQEELARSTDAAALAACWRLYDNQSSGTSANQWNTGIYNEANRFANFNAVAGDLPSAHTSDVTLGHYNMTSQSFDTSNPLLFNAVRVKLHRQQDSNGEVPLFFGAALGRQSQAMTEESIAAMATNIDGFYTPGTAYDSIDILPFALDLQTWNDVLAGRTPDVYNYNNGVGSGSNGFHECNLYPQGTGSPGNRGTVDIGGSNNSTNDITRQIVSGISRQDILDLGKPLALNSDGELLLNGDTGISAGVKDDLASIIGQKRVIPIFSSVSGNGNNATYRIVKFAGIRILNVKLTGKMSEKRVTIEPAAMVVRGVHYTSDSTSRSDFVYSPVMLVQ